MAFGKLNFILFINAIFILSGCSLEINLKNPSLSSLAPSPGIVVGADALAFDVQVMQFGQTAVGSSVDRYVTVTNQGDRVVTQLQEWFLNSPFNFSRLAFPGTYGTCTDSLNPGESCLLHLEFTAPAPASFQGELKLKYLFKGEDRVQSLPLQAAASSSQSVVDLQAGSRVFCARLSNSSLRCWGEGGYSGQLGTGIAYVPDDGSTVPVTPIGMDSDVEDFVMGTGYTCAIKVGGQLWCWGESDPFAVYGVPKQPQMLLASGVEKVSLGGGPTGCAVVNGSVKCWGYDIRGLVGDGEPIDEYDVKMPTDVVGLSGTFIDIAVSGMTACALNSVKQVFCWGVNSDGSLGQPDNIYYSAQALQAQNMPADFLNVVAGEGNVFCGLTERSIVYCWGSRLGRIPLPVAGVPLGISNLRNYDNDSFCVTESGESALWCWDTSPQIATRNNFDLSHISSMAQAGYMQNICAISEGIVKCRGLNTYGILGIGGAGSFVPMNSPVELPRLENVKRLSMSEVGVALHENGAMSCWGDNAKGLCGSGDNENISLPKKIFHTGVTHFKTTSIENSCIIRNSQVRCSGAYYERNTFEALSPDLNQATYLGGQYHYCAVNQGAAYCWGDAEPAALGVNSCNGDCETTPQAVSNMASEVTVVSTGYNFSCAIKDSRAFCWGDNTYNTLGSPGPSSFDPREVSGSFDDVTAIVTGYQFACLSRASGGVYCWGVGLTATPALASGTDSLIPENLELNEDEGVHFNVGTDKYLYEYGSLSQITPASSFYQGYSIEGGGSYTFCRIESGRALCYGSNKFGQLGLSDPSPSTFKATPFPVYDLFGN